MFKNMNERSQWSMVHGPWSMVTLFFGLAVLLFFGMLYPHHLHYQEQFQLFIFDSTYVWEIIKLPGGVADLLGRFCTQFFLFAWVGALIISVLLSAVQLLTLRLASWGRLYGLSFVPSCLLWLFLLDENALLGGVWAVLLSLLAGWAFDHLPWTPTQGTQAACLRKTSQDGCPRTLGGWTRPILLIIAVPLLYWIAGPVCILFFLLQAPRPKRFPWYYGLFILLALLPVLLSFYLPIPADKLWFGIHYHRYPTVFPVLLWVAVLSIFVLTLIARALHYQRSMAKNAITQERSQWSMVNGQWSMILIAIAMAFFVSKKTNFKAEKVMQYDFMARHQQWNRILDTVNAEKPNNPIGVTVQNLALGMHGLLPDHLFEYNQNGILGLFPDVERDATSPLPTAEVFYQLGMINVAQRTVFEAQEAILDFQKSARCYKRLAQTNLINGDYEVARKYLMALQKTLFYSDWANETLPLLGNEEAIAKHPEYGRLRQFAYKDDFYFSDHTTSQMLQSLFLSNTDNKLAYEYLLAYCLLTGDRETYYQFTSIKQ